MSTEQSPRERALRLVKQAKREPYYSELEQEVASLKQAVRLALLEGHRNGWIACWLQCNPDRDFAAAQDAYLLCAAPEGK